MKATVLIYVIPVALGFIGGVIGSLIAPWVQWGVEKRRLRQAKRRELISACRILLATDIDKKTFREAEFYLKLRPHLYQLVIDEIESDDTAVSREDAKPETDRFKKKMLEDVARIEKEWILI